MDESINLRYVVFLAATAAMGGLLFGFDIAIITGAGPFITQAFHLSDLGLGWAFSSLLFGCVLGSAFAGKLADRYGRRRLLIFVALLFASTSVAAGLAGSFNGFVAARFIGGLAVGGVSLISPMYVAEIAPPSIRGRLGTLYQMSIVTGIIVSYGINYLLRDAGANNWRWMFLTGVVPSAVFLLFVALAPETPRFLAMAGKPQEALKVLERITDRQTARLRVQRDNSQPAQQSASLAGTLQARGPPRPGGQRRPGDSGPGLGHQYHHRLRARHLSVGRLENQCGIGLNVCGGRNGVSVHPGLALGH